MTAKTKPKPSDRQRIAPDRVAHDTLILVAEQPAETPSWHEQAAFHVTLDHQRDAAGVTSWQTHAYHEETGNEQVQSGVLDQALIGWMRERAGLANEPPTEPVEATLPATQHATSSLSVGMLEVFELATERQSGGAEIGAQLCARVSFDLAGPLAYIATAELAAYVIQVLALESRGAQSTLLASYSQKLRPELASYSETLELELPPVGSYQLFANVVLPNHDAAAVALGPVLHVVP